MKIYEDFLVNVVGPDVCKKLGFTDLAIIAGYPPEFPLELIDPAKPFVLEKDKDVFWKKLSAIYPGVTEHPRFMGRVRENAFEAIPLDTVWQIGQ